MELEALRISSQKDSTSGILFKIVNGVRYFMCYTLEDERRDKKVYGETRIPAGTYEIKLRTEGGFHKKYCNRYGFHVGMLHIVNVPGFEHILIHSGNTDEHTAGCLLVGNDQKSNVKHSNGFVGASRDAYEDVYPEISEAILNGEKVTITYIDYA